MEKKIIAIALIFVLMVTCFVGCTKKLETTTIGNKEYALVTDENGETVTNGVNQLVAIVTDADGEAVTYENGEEQTYLIEFEDAAVVGDYMRGKNYTIGIETGWTGATNGNIYKDGTDNDCYIQYALVNEVTDEMNLKIYTEILDDQNAQLKEGFEGQGYKVEFTSGEAVIGTNGVASKEYIYKIMDADGNIIHYAENYYFVEDETIYKIGYVCTNGVGYDESFNFKTYLNKNFTYLA